MARTDGAGVSLRARVAGAIVVLSLVAIAYGVLTALALLPMPSSVPAIAKRASVGRRPVIVAGYFISQPFTSLGSGLPPYVLAQDTKPGSPSIHVKPSLADVRPGRVAVIVDTETGDGSQWSPDLVRTIAGWNVFLACIAAIIIILIVVALALGGPLGARLFGGRVQPTGRVPQRQT